MRRFFVLLVTAMLVIATGAGAETRTKLTSSGSWTAYRATDLSLTFNRKKMTLDTACIAEAEIRNGTLRLIMFGDNQLITQVISPNWSFRRRMKTMLINWGNANVTYGDTEYVGDRVQQWGSGNVMAIVDIALKRLGGDTILVRNDQDKVIAQFPMSGLRPVLDRARKCAGLK